MFLLVKSSILDCLSDAYLLLGLSVETFNLTRNLLPLFVFSADAA